MNNEIDDVAEIVRMFRLLDPYDQSLTKGLLDQIMDIEKLKAKKVSPPQHQKA